MLPRPRRLRLSLALVALLVAGVTGVAICVAVNDRITVRDVERSIDEELPRGSTEEEIVSFLDQEGAEYDRRLFPAGEFSVLEDRGIPAHAMVISAIIRDTCLSLIGKCHITIYFILSEDGTLDQYLVKEVHG